MPRPIVIDACVALKWEFRDEDHTETALALLSAAMEGSIELVAPMLWVYEIANVLRSAAASSRMTLDDATSEVQILPRCERDISSKLEGSNDLCKGGSMSNDYQSRLSDRRVSIRQAVDQQFIFRQGRQHQARTSSGFGFKWMAGSPVVCLSSETNE